ncbi:F0F1 ATP synthase subunit epsilon [Hyphococcus luteus]|uniref:ATP synthase epsilon chain n=1 Tax=Hyphococcus luteus TaxID=2058213 RepID=A0A2S7K6H3_9PROT|nr:F0F1 ATP synthase subunit epsilon [Marinicaulis flavus]PQA88115.1 F0F1 ATP synthase subunit epsilon [Marinicaulis flavus]
MADKLHFNLVSPEKELMSADVDQVDIPGTEGWLGVLPNHSPLMTTLAPGMVRIRTGSDEARIFVRGGFAEISPAGLTLLAEEAMKAEDLDAAAIAQKVKDAEEDLADADTDEKKLAAQQSLDRLKELQAAL